MLLSALLSLGSLAVAQGAALRGFNYGSTNTDGSAKDQARFATEFRRAQNLEGTSGFTSARLYTMIQGGTANTVSSAIPAAISTKTQLLLGLWGSAGQASFDNEITALKNAITQYGTAFTDLIVGISIGSEDLYRVSPTGIVNMSGAGATPDQLVSYINQARAAVVGTPASGASFGHVDTWTAWVNGSNSAVVNAVDWVGMDGYPYFQTTQSNGIENGESLFFESYNATVAASAGKPVWITETGWPVSGPKAGNAVASLENAETFWQDVACRVLGNINTFWFTLQDAYPTTPAPSFGVIGTDINGGPLYDLTCKNGNQASSASSSSAAATSTDVASPTMPTTAAASSTVSIIATPNSETSPESPVTTVPQSSAPAMTTTAEMKTMSSVMVSAGKTHTVYQTTLETITSCAGGCPGHATSESKAPMSSAPVESEKPTPSAKQITTTAAESEKTSPASDKQITTTVVESFEPSSPVPSAPSTGKECPANLNGNFEYPHLIVPVDSASPDKAYGTSYNGTMSPSISSIFNFDIPPSDAGKTCSFVFLLPEHTALQTSAYTFNGKGGIKVSELSAPATEQTTYNTVPESTPWSTTIPSVEEGSSYVVFSHECAAGARLGFELSSTDGLDLSYFQDYNPSAIGAYITVC